MSSDITVETPTRWLDRRQVQGVLKASGLPSSRPTLERLLDDPASGFPQPRRITPTATRRWNESLIMQWIARSRCSDATPAHGIAS